ncbi:hypothetical protein [Hymenobacter sp. 102]|uniref:hypothetical protein n=1 Tax=Hymenobacter sp. 102 TaxID=3403152 RepID=UPI003CE79F16
MMRKPLLILSSLSLLALASCQKDDEKQPNPMPAEPTPVQEANVNFVYTYPNESKGQTFLAKDPKGKLESSRLSLTFEKELRQYAVTTDERIEFLLPQSRQKSGLVGTYTLSSQPDPGQGEVQATYERPFSGTGSFANKYSGNTSVMQGSFTISDYNASRKLLSGSYTFTIRQIRDPFQFLATGSYSDPRRLCDVKCYGTFREIPLQ